MAIYQWKSRPSKRVICSRAFAFVVDIEFGGRKSDATWMGNTPAH